MDVRLALCVFLISVIWQLATPTPVSQQVGASNDESERIIGGTSAKAGQFPYAAALFMDDKFYCTASIIGNTTVLTAAHCVQDRDGKTQHPKQFYAIANVSKSSQNVRINFKDLIVHSEYANLNNDIAIFRANQSIPFSDEVKPLCIAGPDTPMNEYRNATAMGWGNTRPVRVAPPNYPDTLQYVNQTILDNMKCLYLGVDEKKLCATGPFNGVCNGDSGGPLVHLRLDTPPVQIGITSYGNAAAGCGKVSPAVWTRVSRFYDFIYENSKGDDICVV